MSSTALDETKAQRIIYVVSAVLCAAVAFLILGPRPEGLAGSVDVSMLPMVNATLNSVTATLLLIGFALIRAGQVVWHKRVMITAFTTSTAFLTTYIVYHWFKSGPAIYEGAFRELYLFILLTHIVLATIILPLALTTLMRGLTGAFDKHRAIAKYTLGVWLYVSITGVLIYWMAHG